MRYALRLRKYLHIPGTSNRLASAFVRMLPRQFATGILGNQYRKALSKTNG